jgi:membrane peptidoglycan carboxypeptidase
MDDVHGIEVTGGSFPAQIWNKFMGNATQGMDLGSFKAPGRFPGKVLNPALVLTSPDESTTTTSSTLLPGEESTSSTEPGDGSSTTSSSTSSTAPATTTTLPPCNPPPNDRDPPWPFCVPSG